MTFSKEFDAVRFIGKPADLIVAAGFAAPGELMKLFGQASADEGDQQE